MKRYFFTIENPVTGFRKEIVCAFSELKQKVLDMKLPRNTIKIYTRRTATEKMTERFSVGYSVYGEIYLCDERTFNNVNPLLADEI